MNAPRPLTPQEAADAAALRQRYAGDVAAWDAAGVIAKASDSSAAAAVRSSSLADAALSAIRGTTDAQRLIATIREGCAPADALLDGMVQVVQLGDPERLLGFMRELQKLIERRAA